MEHKHGQGFHYDEMTRRKILSPEEILSRVGLRDGMTFADIGCNDGFFTIPATRVVGAAAVYAVDVDTKSIERLQEKARVSNLKNIHTLVQEAETTIFCKRCVDMIFFGTVMHDFQNPLKVLENAKEMLTLGGKVVNLDWKKIQTEMGPPIEIRLSEEDTKALVEHSGLKVVETIDLSENFYITIATLK